MDKPYLTPPGARENFIDRLMAKMDLEKQIKITHVDQQGIHHKERKYHGNTSGELQRVQRALIRKGNSIEGFYNPSDLKFYLYRRKEIIY